MAGAGQRALLRQGLAMSVAAMALAALPARAASFTTSLDRSTVVVGEAVGLTLTFEGGSVQRSPNLPAIAGVEVAPGMASGMNTSVGPDGKTITVQTFKFTLVPTQPGEVTIPAFQIELNGQRLSSQPLLLKVLREDPSAPPSTLADQAAFLWPVWPKRECYVNEVLALELRLYLHSGVRKIGDFQLSPLAGEGFTANKWVQGESFQRRVGSAPFAVVPLLTAFSPRRPGVLKIEPLQGSVVLNPREWPDFDSIFSRKPPPQQVALKFDAQELRVLPLPTNGVPASFNGAVGTFALAVSAGPTNVVVGDPVTVRIQLTGRGALEALALPDQPAWKEFEVYSSSSKIQTTDALGVQGVKLFEQVVAPQNADLQAIPPVEFSFFDQDQRAYRTLQSAPVPLTVRAAATVAPVVAATKAPSGQEAPPPAQDIVGLKQHLGTVAMAQPPLVVRSWFLGAQAVPVLAWLAAVGWRKRAEALARNPRLRRRKQVAQIVNDGLEQLRQLAAHNKSDEFFATVFRLLQEQIGERLDLPASSITEAILDERLKPAGLAETASAALHELFQTCNLARFAPVQTSQGLAALVPRVEAVILQLRKFEA